MKSNSNFFIIFSLTALLVSGCSPTSSTMTKLEDAFNSISSDLNKFMPEKNKEVPASIHLDVPLENQMPELDNGCEIVSIQMLVEYKLNTKLNKMEFYKILPIDSTPADISYSDGVRNIISWGDPDKGFVGDVTGQSAGYIINPKPLCAALKKEYPTTKNLTGSSFNALQYEISQGNPVAVWVNKSFNKIVAPDQWTVPDSGKTVNADFDNHTILLTGYDDKYVYYNDPIGGIKDKVEIDKFIDVYTYLGQKAVTIR